MPGGKSLFDASFPNYAQKVAKDPNLNATLVDHFWGIVEACDVQCRLNKTKPCKCCSSFEMRVQEVPLSRGERLGTTQKAWFVALSISNQHKSLFTPTDVIQSFSDISEMPPADGLKSFHDEFAPFRITMGTRVFAFRNPASPTDPWGALPLRDMFRRLAIPDSDTDERYAFEFDCQDTARVPTSLDANIKNYMAYDHGGMTKPPGGLIGLPEVVTPPPLGRAVTKAPRMFP